MQFHARACGQGHIAISCRDRGGGHSTGGAQRERSLGRDNVQVNVAFLEDVRGATDHWCVGGTADVQGGHVGVQRNSRAADGCGVENIQRAGGDLAVHVTIVRDRPSGRQHNRTGSRRHHVAIKVQVICRGQRNGPRTAHGHGRKARLDGQVAARRGQRDHVSIVTNQVDAAVNRQGSGSTELERVDLAVGTDVGAMVNHEVTLVCDVQPGRSSCPGGKATVLDLEHADACLKRICRGPDIIDRAQTGNTNDQVARLDIDGPGAPKAGITVDNVLTGRESNRALGNDPANRQVRTVRIQRNIVASLHVLGREVSSVKDEYVTINITSIQRIDVRHQRVRQGQGRSDIRRIGDVQSIRVDVNSSAAGDVSAGSQRHNGVRRVDPNHPDRDGGTGGDRHVAGVGRVDAREAHRNAVRRGQGHVVVARVNVRCGDCPINALQREVIVHIDRQQVDIVGFLQERGAADGTHVQGRDCRVQRIVGDTCTRRIVDRQNTRDHIGLTAIPIQDVPACTRIVLRNRDVVRAGVRIDRAQHEIRVGTAVDVNEAGSAGRNAQGAREQVRCCCVRVDRDGIGVTQPHIAAHTIQLNRRGRCVEEGIAGTNGRRTIDIQCRRGDRVGSSALNDRTSCGECHFIAICVQDSRLNVPATCRGQCDVASCSRNHVRRDDVSAGHG